MKNLISILLILAIASCKKEEFNPNLTKEFSIHSKEAGADYTIKVAIPENYNPQIQKYSAIYVLDGEENFTLVSEKTKKASSDVLVVSIGYGNDRTVDYTPSKADEGEGGAENFMRFIANELLPRMENEFGADTSRKNRTILGHSFGGLLGAYAFTNHNDVFGNYILLSPSLWYDNEILLKFEGQNRNFNKSNHQLVFMGLGETESSGRMLAPYIAFYQRLRDNYPDMEIKNHLVPHMDHVGSKNPNIEAGLNFYFQNR